MNNDREYVDAVVELVDYLGLARTAERLEVSPEDVRDFIIGEMELSPEVLERVEDIMQTIGLAVERAGVGEGEGELGEGPLMAPEPEEGAEDLKLVTMRMPVLNGTGVEQATRGDGLLNRSLLESLYEQRLTSLRLLRDVTVSRSERMQYQLLNIEIELQIIWDMEETLPVPGASWNAERRDGEIHKRLNDKWRLEEQLRRSDGGLKGLVRRLLGRHQDRVRGLDAAMSREREFMSHVFDGDHRNGKGPDDKVEKGVLRNLWDDENPAAPEAAD